MARFGLIAMTLLFGAVFWMGCSGDCTSADDCKSTEVCYKQVCTPAAADYVRCSGDEDCNGEGGAALFVCRGGTCRIAGGGGGNTPDSGTPDTGMTPRDAGTPDTGTSTITDGG